MFVLLQPGKSDASQVFGGGVNSAAFGPRGTQTVLAKITITAAIAFFLIAFLFSIPGLFEKRSLGQGVGPAESAPAPVVPEAPADQVIPVTPTPVQPSDTSPAAKAANENISRQAKEAAAKGGTKSGNANKK
jgi:protein translocase SecG subunit